MIRMGVEDGRCRFLEGIAAIGAVIEGGGARVVGLVRCVPTNGVGAGSSSTQAWIISRAWLSPRMSTLFDCVRFSRSCAPVVVVVFVAF